MSHKFLNAGRDRIPRFIDYTFIINPPSKHLACRGSKPFAAGGGEVLAGFHNDIHSPLSGADLSAIQINGYHVQAIRAQSVRKFQDGAETDIRAQIGREVVIPVACRIIPTGRTVRRTS